MLLVIYLLIFLISQCQVTICRGVENDSVQEEIAQLRAQIKELTSTVENGKKREDELVKKLEGLAMKEEETAKKLYGLSIKEDDSAKRVDGLAAEVHENHKTEEETTINLRLKLNTLSIRDEEMVKKVEQMAKQMMALTVEIQESHKKYEEMVKEVGSVSKEIKEIQKTDKETSQKVGGLAAEIKEIQEMDEGTAKKVDGLTKKVQENNKKEAETATKVESLTKEVEENYKKVEGLTKEVEENDKKDDKTVKKVESLSREVADNRKKDTETATKVEGLTRYVEENHKKDEKTAKKVEGLSREVEENHKKDTETATKVEGLSTNVNEYCLMLPKDICGPCQCKDDRRLQKQYFCNCQHLPIKRDCLQYHKEGFRIDGLYRIHQNNLKVIQVHCDQTTDQGGWTVFQRRLDGSVKFYRNWDSYKRGFGELQHEFWLGNDNLFTMSAQGLAPAGNQLRIDMEDWDGNKRYETYQSFQVANEKRNYQMYLSDYSGTAGDGMSYHNGMKFSTFDRDNDQSGSSCAQSALGGWWYNACNVVNPNGKYYDYAKWGPAETGIQWRAFQGDTYSLKFIELKMRRKV